MGRPWRPGRTPPKHRSWKLLPHGCKDLRGRSFCRQMQRVIINVQSFMRAEADNNGPLLPLDDILGRTCAALQIGRSSAEKYINRGIRQEPLLTPGRRRPRKKAKRDVDSFTKTAIRNLIYEFHRKKKHMTLDKLMKSIKDRGIDFHGKKDTLRKLIMDLGFNYKKYNGLKVLMEDKNIAEKRYQFLCTYRDNATSEKPMDIVSLDETWEFMCGMGKHKLWQDKTSRGVLPRPSSSGARFIIGGACTRKGFIPGSTFFIQSCKDPQKADDYHHDMNGPFWHSYMDKDVICNLKEPSYLEIDNAPYHTVQANLL